MERPILQASTREIGDRHVGSASDQVSDEVAPAFNRNSIELLDDFVQRLAGSQELSVQGERHGPRAQFSRWRLTMPEPN